MTEIVKEHEGDAPRRIVVDTSTIPGWGVDADPQNDPTYPMRDRSQDDSPGSHWPHPPQQSEDIEVLMSVEYNRRPAVFGTASPPSGLSGVLRRAAFEWSESRWIHWLLLLAADRINVVEGVIEDLGRGKIPNLVDEFGLAAEWKYDRKAFAQRAAGAAAVTAGAVAILYLLSRRGDHDDREATLGRKRSHRHDGRGRNRR